MAFGGLAQALVPDIERGLHDLDFTRARPYRKNDQAWVEQKNGAVVRCDSSGYVTTSVRQN